MASNESTLEVLSLVFDPNVDFTVSSQDPTFSSLPFKPNYSSGTDSAFLRSQSKPFECFFDDEIFKQELTKAVPGFIGSIKGLTNAPLAEVHQFKLSSNLFRDFLKSFRSTTAHQALSFIETDLTEDLSYNKVFELSSVSQKTFKFGSLFPMAELTSESEILPTIHSPKQSQNKERGLSRSPSCLNGLKSQNLSTSKPCLLVIPHEDVTGHHEIFKEVYRYPSEYIETVFEKEDNSVINESNSERAKVHRRLKRKSSNSQASLSSSNSGIGTKSCSSLVSQTEKGLTQSTSTNTVCVSDCRESFESQGLYVARKSTYDSLGNFVNEVVSDTSSNVSTMSDLSGYEGEYATIRRLVADGKSHTFESHNNLNEPTNKKSFYRAKILEQESIIKTLNCQKEDLEIQVHRLSTQLQNAVREKDIFQDQLDIMRTKEVEKHQHDYFELLKHKVSLEGQIEALQNELQHSTIANAELEAKLRQNYSDKKSLQDNHSKYIYSENEMRKKIKDLEDQVIHSKSAVQEINEKVKAEENLSSCLKLEIETKENSLTDLKLKLEENEKKMEDYKKSAESLKKLIAEYSEREERLKVEGKRMQKLLTEYTEHLESTKKSCQWYQQQLKKSHSLQSEMQKELTETKTSLSVVSAERERLRKESEKLTVELEDNRAKAIRDKSLLLVQLEELEGDMREREVVIKHLEEGHKNIHVRLTEERFKRLEEDHKKLQELRMQYRDIVRINSSLKDELKHKTIIGKKNDDTIHNLRKSIAVTEEELNSKKVYIHSLEEKLSEAKLKTEKGFDLIKEKERVIDRLREEKFQLEASVVTAEQDKKQVDQTVGRLKEDLSKLKTSYFRMKHDISAKDKQIELLSKQNAELNESTEKLTSEIEELRLQNQNEDKIELKNEIKLLRESLTSCNMEIKCKEEKISKLNMTVDSVKAENASLLKGINLRDEQVCNFKGVVETYKEKIIQKDEEMFAVKEQLTRSEKNYIDLNEKYISLKNEHQLYIQENEALHDLEVNYKNTIAELKDSIRFEKRNKDNWEKKYNEIAEQLGTFQEEIKEKDSLKDMLAQSRVKLKQLKYQGDEVKRLSEETDMMKQKMKEREITIQSLRGQIEELRSSIELTERKYEEGIQTKNDTIKMLQDSINTKNYMIKNLEQNLSMDNQNNVVPLMQTRGNVMTNSNEDITLNHDDKDSVKYVNSNDSNDNNNNSTLQNEDEQVWQLKQRLWGTSNHLPEQEEIDYKDYKLLETHHQALLSELTEVKNENIILRETKEKLDKLCRSLESDSRKNFANFLEMERECHEWKVKYENLSDIIPQRDTDCSQKLYEEPTVAPSSTVLCSLQMDGKGNVLEQEKSGFQDFNMEERIKFTQTMLYLQKQISFTAEALKSKDQQISELNEKLKAFTSTPSYSQTSSSFACPQDESQLSYQRDASTYIDNDFEDGLDDPVKEIAAELSKIKEILALKEAEFKEKQRRNDSNLRLLTRKLKEHMQGRRLAEKKLELIVKEHKAALDEEKERTQEYKNKFFTLEKQYQQLELEINFWKTSSKDQNSTIQHLERAVEKGKESVLHLQKEIGQNEQLRKSYSNLKEELRVVNWKLVNKIEELEKTKDDCRVVLEGKNSLEEKCNRLMTQVTTLKEQLAEESKKFQKRGR